MHALHIKAKGQVSQRGSALQFKVCERDRERGRQTDRERGRQTDRESNEVLPCSLRCVREIERGGVRERERERER